MNYETDQAIRYLKHSKEAMKYIFDYEIDLIHYEDFMFAFENDIKDNCPNLKTNKINWEKVANYFLS